MILYSLEYRVQWFLHIGLSKREAVRHVVESGMRSQLLRGRGRGNRAAKRTVFNNDRASEQ